MRKKSAKKKSNNFRDILDSDDELPTEYIDLPFVPAYQMDNRFDYIEEKKVEKVLKQKKKGLSNSGPAVTLGYFNKKDTFCFQSLEPTTGRKTQQWLFNFLMLKDLHSSYTFLTTCLVPSYGNDNYKANKKFFKDCN